MQRPKNGVVDPGGVCVGEASGGDEGRQDELEEGGGADRGQRVGPLDRLHKDQHHALHTTTCLSSVQVNVQGIIYCQKALGMFQNDKLNWVHTLYFPLIFMTKPKKKTLSCEPLLALT